ncbi:MAG: hypothetical protein JWR07_360, partial [Nevskia sp.]|nr:hypothetical protein [Nevskia sp.]
GEGGTISGWSPGVSATTTVTMYDDATVNPANPAVYKGLAIANTAGGNELFAADFHNNKIDVFNSLFKKVTAPGGFIDPALPAGYAPFNIQALGNMLYVAYAVQDAKKHDETDGVGLGLVDVFDLNGNLAQHLIPVGGALNAPWGLSMAPSDFGAFSGDLLVGNFGDGRINVYNPVTGTFVAALSDSSGKAIAIPGLWGIAFGNDAVQQPHNALFFTAGPNGEADGLYGRIDLPGNSPAGSSSSGGSGSSSSSSGGTTPTPIGY